MNKLQRIQRCINIFEMNSRSINHSNELMAIEGERLAGDITEILKEPDYPNEDILKPTASEVQQMIKEAMTDHYNKWHRP